MQSLLRFHFLIVLHDFPFDAQEPFVTQVSVPPHSSLYCKPPHLIFKISFYSGPIVE